MKKHHNPRSAFNDAADCLEEFVVLGQELLKTISDWTWHRKGLNKRVDDLLARGASVHTEDAAGNTALMLATQNRLPGIARKIIEAGGDANTKNRAGDTPLIRCALDNNPQIALLLLRAHARAEECNTSGQNMMTIAAAKGFTDFLDIMVEGGGISPDLCDHNKNTPLCTAAAAGQEETVHALVKHGANLFKTGSHGKVPAEKAFEHAQSPALANTLMRAMKNVIEANLTDDISQIIAGTRKDIAIGKPLALTRRKLTV